MRKPFRNAILVLLSILLLCSAGLDSIADEVIFGDADGDGELTAQDASCISRHLNRFRMMDAAGMSRADFDGDGEITERDATMILSSSMAAEFAVPVTKSFSMLLTSDIAGNAWDPKAAVNTASVTAINTATCIRDLREADPYLLLFDVGGSIFGSSIADDYADRIDRTRGPITSLFVQLKYNAVLLGDEAFSYSSSAVRREVNALQNKHISVLGANFLISEPTVFDTPDTLWNGLVPYVVLEVPQSDENAEPMRVAVIGMTDPYLADAYPEDEISPQDLIMTYAKLRKELRNLADYTVLLYHGNTETDAQDGSVYSLRDLLKKTDFIDLVVASHGGVGSVRSEKNSTGTEIPIVSLAGGAETVTKISVSLREKGRPAILVDEINTSETEPDDTFIYTVRPYVSPMSAVMDAAVTYLGHSLEPFDEHAWHMTDAIQLTHEMQLFAAHDWLDYNDVDLPNEMISIAYPYLPIGGLKEGLLKYRDLYVLDTGTPHYSIMIMRGAELRAWLKSYAETVTQQDTVYSLYGLSYLLNTLNPEAPLGYLEYASGRSVDDDDLFTVILAERTEGELNMRQFIDEEWMPYQDRIIEGFTLPKPYEVETIDHDPVVDALVAYLETVRTLELEHLYNWIII
ncbi:MAG: hypothetical protein IKP38_01910 [Clostridia bacterium]|nr:hypothetical protein [Clostridia bacterium]